MKSARPRKDIERLLDLICQCPWLPDDAPPEIRKLWELVQRRRLAPIRRQRLRLVVDNTKSA